MTQDRASVIQIIRLQAIVQRFTLVCQAIVQLLEDGFVHSFLDRSAPVSSDALVHLLDEVVIGDHAILSRGHHSHEVVDLIVAKTNLERVEAEPELLPTDHAVTISVEHREGLLEVKVLNVECSSNLVQCLVETLLPQIYCFELVAEICQIHLADALRICDSAQYSVVLHGEGQVQRVDHLFEELD